MSYQIISINSGEMREFYGRMLGGNVQYFADTIEEAVKLCDSLREEISERDELSTAEIVKVDDDGNRLEIVFDESGNGKVVKKYAVVDSRIDGTGDEFTRECATESEAIAAAEHDWSCLTDRERKARSICAVVSDPDEDSAFNWGAYDIIKEFKA